MLGHIRYPNHGYQSYLNILLVALMLTLRKNVEEVKMLGHIPIRDINLT